MKKLFLYSILGLSLMSSIGCDRDDYNNDRFGYNDQYGYGYNDQTGFNNQYSSLQEIEDSLFQAGVEVQYARNSRRSSGNDCLDLQNLNLRNVSRFNQAVNSLQNYRRALKNSNQCVATPARADAMILNAIRDLKTLENCRSGQRNGRRCSLNASNASL